MSHDTPPIPRIEPTSTVNEALRLHPETAAVFNAFGVDTCCGGERTLRDAAAEDGVNCCALLAELEWTIYERQEKA